MSIATHHGHVCPAGCQRRVLLALSHAVVTGQSPSALCQRANRGYLEGYTQIAVPLLHPQMALLQGNLPCPDAPSRMVNAAGLSWCSPAHHDWTPCTPSPSPAPLGSMLDQFHQGIFPTSREANTPREHCLIPAVRACDGEKRWGAAKGIQKLMYCLQQRWGCSPGEAPAVWHGRNCRGKGLVRIAGAARQEQPLLCSLPAAPGKAWHGTGSSPICNATSCSPLQKEGAASPGMLQWCPRIHAPPPLVLSAAAVTSDISLGTRSREQRCIPALLLGLRQ